MTRIMRIAAGIMLVLFITWAGYQYNDPDALLWSAIYAAAAVFTLLYLLGRFSQPFALAYAGLCVVYAVYLVVRIVISREFIFAEQGREMMGLFICGGWILFLAQRQRSVRTTAASN